jgi:dTDP-4-dehydrorhamnose 3,5-epimerase
MARFDFLPTPLAGVLAVQRRPMADTRGFLSRIYCTEEFAAVGVQKPLAQVNHTLTRRIGTVRGMHFQRPPHAETKLVSCLRGEVFDVAVDVRRRSPTFLQWHADILSAANQRSLLIPEGFAHGFQTLTDDCEVLYLHTGAYDASAEGALNPVDPRLRVRWPLEITELSDRDRRHPMLSDEFDGLEL